MQLIDEFIGVKVICKSFICFAVCLVCCISCSCLSISSDAQEKGNERTTRNLHRYKGLEGKVWATALIGHLPFTKNEETDSIANYSKNSCHQGGNAREPELPLLQISFDPNYLTRKGGYFDHLHSGYIRKGSALWIDEGGQVEHVLPAFLCQVQTLESESWKGESYNI